jgi:hypothetical protein
MSLPFEAEKLLAVPPEDFVEERKRIVRELKDAGRGEDADAVAALRKPPAVVSAVNRAARDRSQSAKDAADAASRLARAQLSGDADAYRMATTDLENALDSLAEVALARLSRGKAATESMRRRTVDLLRSAVADEASREALLRGALVEEGGPIGFGAFAGLTVSPPPPGKRRAKAAAPKRDRAAAERRARRKQLDEELAEAKDALRSAERALREATTGRDRAARAVESLEGKLRRLDD